MDKLIVLAINILPLVSSSFCTNLLINAIRKGDLNIVKTLCNSEYEANCPNQNGATPLQEAAENGHISIVIYLLDRGAKVNKKNRLGWTALHWAARNGHVKIAEILVRNGANVNQQDNYGKTPLHWASYHGHQGIALLLLEHGAHIHITDCRGLTPLMWTYFSCSIVDDLLQAWQKGALQSYTIKLAFCAILHPRLGQKTPGLLRHEFLIQHILHYIHPINFICLYQWHNKSIKK